jgi:hypothetical protein
LYHDTQYVSSIFSGIASDIPLDGTGMQFQQKYNSLQKESDHFSDKTPLDCKEKKFAYSVNLR